MKHGSITVALSEENQVYIAVHSQFVVLLGVHEDSPSKAVAELEPLIIEARKVSESHARNNLYSKQK